MQISEPLAIGCGGSRIVAIRGKYGSQRLSPSRYGDAYRHLLFSVVRSMDRSVHPPVRGGGTLLCRVGFSGDSF